jgi:hypothetical protein
MTQDPREPNEAGEPESLRQKTDATFFFRDRNYFEVLNFLIQNNMIEGTCRILVVGASRIELISIAVIGKRLGIKDLQIVGVNNQASVLDRFNNLLTDPLHKIKMSPHFIDSKDPSKKEFTRDDIRNGFISPLGVLEEDKLSREQFEEEFRPKIKRFGNKLNLDEVVDTALANQEIQFSLDNMDPNFMGDMSFSISEEIMNCITMIDHDMYKPLDAGTFDAAICNHVLEHYIESEDEQEGLPAFNRILTNSINLVKRGGLFARESSVANDVTQDDNAYINDLIIKIDSLEKLPIQGVNIYSVK